MLFELIIYLIIPVKTYSQEIQTPVAPNPHVILPLPNASSLGKYGDIPIGIYTGTLNYDIPIYNYQTKHIQVPISINYSSNGVKVDGEDSKVGTDWVLNSGGVITRTVFSNANVFGGGVATAPPQNGFYPNCNNPNALIGWSNFYLQNATQLDEFNFNFCGYVGKFVLTASGPVQLRYSNLKIEFNGQYPGKGWYFKITTPDGLAYYFGENGATESSNVYSTGVGLISGDSFPQPQLTAFYLTKITHPYDSSDVVNFSYSTHSDNYISNIIAYTRFPDPSCQCSLYTNNFCASCISRPCPYGGHEIWDNGYETYIINKNQGSALKLDSISSSYSGNMNFKYIEKSARSESSGADCLLSEISIFDNSRKLVKAFVLDYHFTYGNFAYPSNNPINNDNSAADLRSFLTTIKERDANYSQVNVTQFSYNDFDNIAPRLSFAQDSYGYFNGKANYRFIPDVDGFQYQHNLPTADRDPDFNYGVKGMLSKITYQTGGYSQFIYEPHSNQVGGVRIKEIDTYDSITQLASVKKYIYGNPNISFVPNFRSREDHMDNIYTASGNTNCYALTLPMICSYIVLTSNSLTPLEGRGGFLVYYNNVTETYGLNSENGGVEHFYNSDPINPLTILQGQPIYGITTTSYNWKWAEETNTKYFKIINNSKIYLKTIANNWITDDRKSLSFTQFAIKKEDFQGSANPSASDPSAQANYLLSSYDIISYVTNQQWNYVRSSTVTDFDTNGSNPVSKTSNYYYDNPEHALLTRTEYIQSNGQSWQEINKYIGDKTTITSLSGGEITAIDKLKDQNRISTLIEKDINLNGNIVNRVHFSYKDWGNSIVLPEIFKSQTGANSLETRTAYQNYNSNNGDLLQFSNVNGPPTTYIWGYNNQYPVAEITNATYQDVINVLGQPVLDQLNNSPGSDGNVQSALNPLRAALPQAQVTTYTYAPLIGMTSMTDPKGITTYYEYDSLQRLMNIKDKDGNIVKHIDYHYANQ